MRKWVYLVALIGLMVSLYYNNQRLAEAQNEVLRVWVTPDEYRVLKAVNPIFEERHGTSVEMEIVTSEQVLAKLPLYVGSPNYPDIVNASHTLITELVRMDLISPITEIFPELNILPSAQMAFKVMGEYYGIPYHALTDVLFYNKEQFPDGVAPYALVDDAHEFSLAIDYRSIYHSLPFITGFGGYTVGLDNFGDINFYDIGLNNENSVVGLAHMIQLLDEGLLSGANPDIFQAFVNGDANLLIAPSTNFESLKSMMPSVGIQAVPSFIENVLPLTYMRLETYQLTRHATNPELAKAYLKFLVSDEVITVRYKLNKSVVPINTETIISQDVYYEKVKKQLHRALPLPNQVEFNFLYRPYRQGMKLAVTYFEEIQGILNTAVREINSQIQESLRQ